MDDVAALAALSALAHADRLRAYRLLVVQGPVGAASGEIAARLGIAPTRMSFHLAALERAGLCAARRDGRQVIYALRPDVMRALLGYLARDCCGGRPEFCDLEFRDPALCDLDGEV